MVSLNIPINEAQLVSLFSQSVFFGIYIVSFGACMRVLLLGNDFRRVNKALLVAAVALAVFGTMSVVLQLVHLLDAFIWYHGPGGSNGELSDISYWVNVMKTVCYIFQTLIGDIILIYRCFVVYERKWLVILPPIAIWIGTIVCSAMVIYITDHLKISTNLNQKQLVPFITSTLVLSLVQNVATVGLIAYRIWLYDREASRFRVDSTHSLRPVIRVILESGALYTVSLAIFLIVFLCSNNGQYIVSDAMVQIIGIVFNVIIIRLHQGRAADQRGGRPSNRTCPITSSGSGGRACTASTGYVESPLRKSPQDSPASEFHALRPVEINVAFERQQKTDGDSPYPCEP